MPNWYMQRARKDIRGQLITSKVSRFLVAYITEQITFRFTLFQARRIDPEVIKTFFMLNSAEHKIYPAHKCQNANDVDILTFISMIHTTSERSRPFITESLLIGRKESNQTKQNI